MNTTKTIIASILLTGSFSSHALVNSNEKFEIACEIEGLAADPNNTLSSKVTSIISTFDDEAFLINAAQEFGAAPKINDDEVGPNSLVFSNDNYTINFGLGENSCAQQELIGCEQFPPIRQITFNEFEPRTYNLINCTLVD